MYSHDTSLESGTIYQRMGYENRKDYLNQLADEYGLDQLTVYGLAELLGKSEDFDGLVSACRDAEEMGLGLE